MENAKDNERDKFLALYRGGRLPDLAHELDPRWSVDDYLEVLNTPETKASFEVFAKDYTGLFMEGIEGMLLGRLYKAGEALTKLDPTEPTYPRVMSEYRKLLELTEPIIVKLKKIQAESFPYNTLHLKIEMDDGDDNTGASGE